MGLGLSLRDCLKEGCEERGRWLALIVFVWSVTVCVFLFIALHFCILLGNRFGRPIASQ